MPDVQRRVVISGRVQGVFFRQTTKVKARELGLCGWVRNRPDGRVEAVFRGPDAAVAEMLHWCRQGPPAAGVTGVEVVDEAPNGALAGFSVR